MSALGSLGLAAAADALTLSLATFGLALVYESTRTLCFAATALFSIAPLLLLLFMRGGLHVGVAAILALGASTVILFLTGFGVHEALLYRRRSAGAHLMATIAASAFSTELAVLVWGNGYHSVRAALPENTFFNVDDSLLSVRLMAGGALSLTFILFWRVSRQLRNRLVAVRENPIYVELHGVRPQQLRKMAYAVLALGTASAGMIFSLETGVTPYTGQHYFSSTVAAVLLIGRFSPILLILVLFVIAVTRSLMVFAFDSKWQEALTYGFLFALIASNRFRHRVSQ